MAGSIILINIVQAKQWTNKIAWLAKPFTRLGRLHDECGISFITAIGSPSAANSMLMNLYYKKTIEKKEMYIAVLSNTFPAILMHWRSMLPTLIPILGSTGLLYFCILLCEGLFRTLIVLLAGRFLLKDVQHSDIILSQEDTEDNLKGWALIRDSFNSSKRLIKRIIFITIPVTLLVYVLVSQGVFDMLAEHLQGVTKLFPVPPEGLSIIAAYFGHSIAAYTVAGSLLNTGVITEKFIVISLLSAQVLATVINIFRYSASYYIGIFGHKIGLELMSLSVGLRIISMVTMIYLVYFFM
jgi:hypothetical protein